MKTPCRFCADPVTATDPACTICRACYFAGREYETGPLAPLVATLRALPGVADVRFEHTGGGCWALYVVARAAGRFLLLTFADDPSLPEVNEPVDIGTYRDADYCEADEFASAVAWADVPATVARMVTA